MALANGDEGWPELPAEPPSLRDLPDTASRDELLRAYSNAFLGFAPLWRKSVHALEFLYGAMTGIKATLERVEKRLDLLALPPMRGAMSSSHDVASAVGADVAREFEAEQRNLTTPPPDAKALEIMIERRVAAVVAGVKESEKAAAWERVEAERKHAENERIALEFLNAQERVKYKWAARMAVTAAVIGALAWIVEHFGHR